MEIRPFRGWRYSAADLSSLIAPPYDVLSAADKQALLAKSDRNIVGVDMPHFPPGSAGPDEVYAQAAATLEKWITDGTLTRDIRAALYAYEQTYDWAGRTYHRRALLCGVRATPLGQDVIPHEHTFAGPKADRLKLTQHTHKQLSPIFGFYDDPAGVIAETLWAAVNPARPTAAGTLNGVGEKIWTITDAATVDAVTAALRPVPVFIADGHHRYTTAMNYRDALLAQGKIDDQHETNFVLFALVASDDPGLLILPTHRMVSGLAGNFSLAALRAAAAAFNWQKVAKIPADLADADAFLKGYGRGAIGATDGRELWVAVLKDPAAMEQAAPTQCPAWRELDVAVLQTLIVDGALKAFRTDKTEVRYTPDGNKALAACTAGEAQLSLLLQGTRLDQVKAVALAGQSMPHKSTYFYPKLATGMVIKPLE
ncbi:MAG: DUF1015 domain-containing protein [Planctomycetaceae bacterium]|nr:DUF1015 domain-containing protein [Planctomycetaceae bacterium]